MAALTVGVGSSSTTVGEVRVGGRVCITCHGFATAVIVVATEKVAVSMSSPVT